MDHLKMRLAEIAAPHVYEIIKHQYRNREWESLPEYVRESFIKEEADVTGPVIDAIAELYKEDSDAGRQLRELLSP